VSEFFYILHWEALRKI